MRRWECDILYMREEESESVLGDDDFSLYWYLDVIRNISLGQNLNQKIDWFFWFVKYKSGG